MTTLRIASLMVLTVCPAGAVLAQNPADAPRISALEQQLLAAQAQVAELEAALATLSTEVTALKEQSAEGAVAIEPAPVADDPSETYADRIVVADLGHDERAEDVALRPELFVQSRYHANPIDEATADDVAYNFAVSRMEMRWAGRVSDSIGVGFELQPHTAPDGVSEELVNDAYVEYYPAETITFRVGQFVKPFGFDIQHSSSAREAPERGIFAGYFFPGQRDRGVMMRAQLDGLASWTTGMTLHAAILNGNRFFNDNNSDVNYNLRLRKVFDSNRLALGASVQLGTQILPPGVMGSADEDIYGLDIQYVVGRLGIRGEYVRGDMPSTLIGLTPDFAPAFTPGAESTGVAAFFNFNLTAKDDIYWRWDRFENDPVTGLDITAFNIGYLRRIGEHSRIGIDYQTKDDVTFNDDELNTKFAITWNLLY